MRRLAPSEHGVLTDAFVELEGHLAMARWHAERARGEGRDQEAHLELDHARSALGELTDLAGELDEVLDRLARITQRETKPRGRAPKLARNDDRKHRSVA